MSNNIESFYTISPHERSEEVAKITIDDTSTVFILQDITVKNEQYTLSLWMCSEQDSIIVVDDDTVFSVSPEWTKYTKTFVAKDNDLVFSFTNVGRYYIYHPKLEKGNRATDWTPAPEDMASMEDLNSTRDSLNKVIFEQSSSLTTNVNSISASVRSLETKLNEDVDGLNNRIETVEKDVQLKVTDESVDIKIQKAIYDGSKKVDTGTGITFDENGMNVSKEDAEGNKVGDTNTQITENGMYVNSNVTNTPVLTANKDGVQAKNLHAGKYLIIDDKSRFEAYGTDRVGCFWIGE